MKKNLKRIIQAVLLLLAVCIILILHKLLPLINGYAAKTTCSSVFVAQRPLADIEKEELGTFPFNLVAVSVNTTDSSVTSAIAGLAKRKAIFRKGLGATLISDIPEEELRKQTFRLAIPPVVNQDSIGWPQGNRIGNSLLANFDTLQTDAATRALVIVYRGQIVAEKYAKGFTVHTRQLGWSMTKGIENALLGILVKEQKLTLNAPAPLQQWEKDERKKISIANLMQMSSGLHYASSATGPSDLTDMLFMKGDMPGFAINAKPEHAPGQVFHYADASANILSFIERKLLGDSAYYKFPYQKLFYKIGMHSALLETDEKGNFVGSSYCYATARDWARLGLLYLYDGVWNGERILPEGWVRFTATAAPAKNEEKKGEYGALWWLNAENKKGVRKFAHVPADGFACLGYEGQFVWVIPSKQLVVVRLALERGKKMDTDKFLSGIIKALPE